MSGALSLPSSATSDQSLVEPLPGQSWAGDGATARLPGRPKRPGLRIALISLGSVFALVAAAVAARVIAADHLASQIRREPVYFARLTADGHRMADPVAGSANVLITGTGGSGLVLILHINANHQAGGAVLVPPRAEVSVPGHGRLPVQRVLAAGGPSLLISALAQTGVRISHWAGISLGHLPDVVSAEGGVSVTLPAAASSDGFSFHAGTNHLDGAAALAYARQTGLSGADRVLRQESLLRAVLAKIAGQHLIAGYHVLSAAASMLTVDSSFTNGELTALAVALPGLSDGAGVFLTAPAYTSGGEVLLSGRLCGTMWHAVNTDALAAFARRHPSTVTPADVP